MRSPRSMTISIGPHSSFLCTTTLTSPRYPLSITPPATKIPRDARPLLSWFPYITKPTPKKVTCAVFAYAAKNALFFGVNFRVLSALLIMKIIENKC